MNRCLAIAFVTFLVGFFFAGLSWSHPPPPMDQRFDEANDSEVRPSLDLDRDRQKMWRIVPIDSGLKVSPVSAINAASRVFATINFEGRSTNEIRELIGFSSSNPKSSYTHPFFPIEAGTTVYRFDCGYYGWQFNLKYDSNGVVTCVERLWIH